MKKQNQTNKKDTPSGQGGVMLRDLKRKRDFFIFFFVSHICLFPLVWISLFVHFQIYIIWGAIIMLFTTISSLFLVIKYDNKCNGIP